MYEIKLLNLKENVTFTKQYNSYYMYFKELQKYKNSKKLQVLSYGKI